MKKKIVLLFLLPMLSWAQQKDVLRFSMDTPWTDAVQPDNVWNVYPRPQMKRDNWQNLNGTWQYAITPKEAPQPAAFDGDILVPFAVESQLSGVKKTVGEDNILWYKTTFKTDSLAPKQRLHLHFGAVDWKATVYVNGRKAGEHKGGFTPFHFDITSFLEQGEQQLVVKVWDPTDAGTQARGKQVADPTGIWYTPVTGIWQTVWLEKTAGTHIRQVKNTPDIDRSALHTEIAFSSPDGEGELLVKALDHGEVIASETIALHRGDTIRTVSLDIPGQRLWSPSDPHLYDLEITLTDKGSGTRDQVMSYFGMRKIALGKDDNGYTRILLNDKPVFQFGLLDQGWWPDGLFTAPTEEAMMYDVEMTRKWGFNMLRKHVKVEPASFYYQCDKMGMLVWQDMPNGNYFKDLRIEAWETEDAHRTEASARQFEAELREMMDAFHNFTSIVVWVPFNEGWGQYDTERVTRWVEKYDPSRLIDSPSGWADRGVGDMIDIHLYPGPGLEYPEANRASVLGEFGGIGWAVPDHMWWNKRNWGYLTMDNQDAFKDRFRTLVNDLVSLKSFGLSAAVYTQTTDVEGEVNGMMTYDREVIKISPEETRPLFDRLYNEAEKHHVLIADSEHGPTSWTVRYKAGKRWYKPSGKLKRGTEKQAPFSTYDNYALPEGSTWDKNEDLFLYKEFEVEDVPETFVLRYYLDKADMDIYINGRQLMQQGFKGGRKRHYRNQLIENAAAYLHTGKNHITVSVKGKEEERSFDLGIYTTSVSGKKEADGTGLLK
ncbi:glycoside hydrolase family 2 protein [Sinomicrobium soli]|uniref:glycoside hydrolase family 2 protein n=1 Tax=Sinomicrobium sp. N-1-3-6 TaxID=2219864 RepID=UPI000DCEC529|nr:sugar-binding domain-containing protein [Sinomicrobium sp. N-1-3-6]RAV29591.1 beta-galactosidase [Sinomicrobium sp. N-1-3-6]